MVYNLCIGSYIPDTFLRVVQICGVGAQGTVVVAIDVMTSEYFAVKCISKRNLLPQQCARLRVESELHMRVSGHPNIVPLLDVIENDHALYLVMECVLDGDLFTHIVNHQSLCANEMVVRRAFLQLVDAVLHCHFKGVYHRDLKPENILVADKGQTLLLTDFGLACDTRLSPDVCLGSPYTMAPECIRRPSAAYDAEGDGFYDTAAADVWSLGVLLLNLLSGRNPWQTASPHDPYFAAFLEDPDSVRVSFCLSDQLHALLLEVFTIDPSARCSLKDFRARFAQLPRLLSAPTQAAAAASTVAVKAAQAILASRGGGSLISSRISMASNNGGPDPTKSHLSSVLASCSSISSAASRCSHTSSQLGAVVVSIIPHVL